MRYLIAFCLVLFAAVNHAEALQTAPLTVKSRPAAALVDVVRPLLGESGGVSAFHDKLIVRGTARQISEVRALLRELDRPPRRLIVEVRHAGGMSASRRGFGYGVNTGEARIGRAPAGEGVHLQYGGIQTRGRDDGLQRVQAIEGRPALIRTGQSTPVYNSYQGVIGGRFVQGFDMHYRDTSSGFYALPRVHGDQVTVEILQQDERPGTGGRFVHQQASSVLRGSLGKWMTLGSVGGSDHASDGAPGWHAQTRRSRDRHIEMRVVAVD